MSRLACGLFLFASVLPSGSAFADAPHKLVPGQWQYTTTFAMDGQTFGQPPQTFERCISADEAKDPMRTAKVPDECTTTNLKREGNTLRSQVTCHLRGGTQNGEVVGTYGNETLTMTTTTSMNDPKAGAHTMVSRMDGRRIGECAAK